MADCRILFVALLAAAADAQHLRGANSSSSVGDTNNSSNFTLVASDGSCIEVDDRCIHPDGSISPPHSAIYGGYDTLKQQPDKTPIVSYRNMLGEDCFLRLSECPDDLTCLAFPKTGTEAEAPSKSGFFGFPEPAEAGKNNSGFHQNSYVMCTSETDTNTTSSP